jgi:nucleoside 2-deoxyribosyltransferase
MKIYLAHPISTTGEFNDSLKVAESIRSLGYEVFVASENTSINDKSNNPTPKDIYRVDVGELLSSDILVANLTGGQADGTITEIGVVAGYNEAIDMAGVEQEQIPIIGYTSNKRLLQPQFHKGIPSASANHLTLGAIEEWGHFAGSEVDMINALGKLKEEL